MAVGGAHEVGPGSVKDADVPFVDGSAVLAGVKPLPCWLDTNKLNGRFFNELSEHTDGIGPTTNAGGNHIGQSAGAF